MDIHQQCNNDQSWGLALPSLNLDTTQQFTPLLTRALKCLRDSKGRRTLYHSKVAQSNIMTDQQNQNKLNITQKYSSTFHIGKETQFLDKNDILPQCAIAITRRVSFRIRKKILLPTFLQTDAVDDSLIDLSSGPPGFLNDPIFTPSNAHLSIHSTTSYAY